LRHPANHFVLGIFKWDRDDYLLGLTSNRDPPDLCLLGS
jgi:hypothetical protein